MRGLSASLPLTVTLALLVAGCGGDDGSPVGPDSGRDGADAGDAGDDIDLQTYLDDNGILRLELQDDGTEYGEAMTDESGVVRFYSALHEGVFDMSVAEREMDMPLGGRRVQISVADELMAYLVTDPLGMYAPLLHTVPVPEVDTTVDVDAIDVMVEQEGIPDYDPERDGDPFMGSPMPIVAGHAAPLTIIGITFSMSIRSFLTGIAVSAAAAVFKSLVEDSCRFVAPLYAERCRVIGNLASAIGRVVGAALTGGISLSGATAWRLGDIIVDEALSAAGYHCDTLGKTLVGYVVEPEDESARTRFREVARKFNYLLYKMETDPRPDQPTWAEAEEMAAELIAVREVVRNRYFQLWSGEAFDSAAPNGFWMGRAKSATKSFLGSRRAEVQALVLTRLVMREEVRAYLEVGAYDARYVLSHYRYVQADWESFEFTVTPSARQKAMNNLLVSCAFNFVSGAVGEWADGSMRRNWELETREMVNGMLEVLERTVDAVYELSWGSTIPPGMCLADDYEPNSSWEQAFASPIPVELGSPDVVELPELTLCDAIGSGGDDEDWYGYYIGPIDFRVQARIIGVDGGRGQDEPVCLDVYFYSEIYEIGGLPPDLITGVCGRVSDWPATDPFGVRRTIGERWSMILLRVHHGPGGTGGDVEYGLRFTP